MAGELILPKVAAPTNPVGKTLVYATTATPPRLIHIDDTPAAHTLVGADTTDALSNKTIITSAGTNAVAPIVLTHGTNLTNAVADALENDAIGMYLTTNTTDGRGHIPARQHFRLTINGGSITTIANVFGTTSNISLVASAYYNIEIFMLFLKSSTGDALTITLTNSAAPTSQNIFWEQSPLTGVVAAPGTAGTWITGMTVNDATAAKAIVTGTLTASVNHIIHIKLELKNGTGTSLKIQATNATGVTPLLGSYWIATRIPTGNTGTFAA